MNKLLRKGISNIYLKIATEKKRSQNFDFLSLKIFVSRSVFWELQLALISLNFKTSCWNLKIRALGAKMFVFFLLFLFWKELWRFKVKESMHLLNKNIYFNKTETESKIENPTHSFRETSLPFCFISYKNHKIKVKLWWVGACESKKKEFSEPFILSEGNFFNICVFFRCIVYWIHFQNNIHAYFYKSKNINSCTFLLVFIIVESLQCILKRLRFSYFWFFINCFKDSNIAVICVSYRQFLVNWLF